MTQPTDREQYALELVNRLRLDPAGSFDRFIEDAATGTAFDPGVTSALAWFFVDLDALRDQLDALEAVAPLAWNGDLHDAAAGHNAQMQAADEQSHQVDGEPGLGDRVDATGYLWMSLAENVYAYAENPDHAHAGFVIDWGYDTGETPSDRAGGDGIQDPAGHRIALMSDAYTEIGIDWLADSSGLTSVGPWLTTQVLGRPAQDMRRITGVVYEDADGDGAYSMGEGVGGAAIDFDWDPYGETMDAGGYSIEMPNYTGYLTFTAEGMEMVRLFASTRNENAKIDVTTDGHVYTSVSVYASNGVTGITVLGNDSVRLSGYLDTRSITAAGGDDWVSGGRGAEVIHGGDGDDHLSGRGGADVIRGEGGFDVIDGGALGDRLAGGAQGDEVTGGRGWDRIYGGSGDDRLFGEEGNDRLFGGQGRDRLVGGDGDDTLRGGRGRDVFAFDSSDGTDRIEDWDARDQIYLRGTRGDMSNIAIGTDGDDAILAYAQTTVIIEGAALTFSEADLVF